MILRFGIGSINVSNKILIITPPDKIFNQNTNVLVICASERTKEDLQNILGTSTGGQNVYLYEPKDEEEDIEWLLTVAKMSEVVILDLDNASYGVRQLASYLISLPQTYWLTNSDEACYNMLSPNRIYALDSIKEQIGGKLETKQ